MLIGIDPPMSDQFFSFIQTKFDIRVADVDTQQHTSPRLAVRDGY
jgi:hypothetical protein